MSGSVRRTRDRMRVALVLAGVLPALVALLFSFKVVVMLAHDRAGRADFDDAAYLSAAEEFAANGSVNWFEPWVSAFDEGAALHAAGDLEGAVERYLVALEDVPPEEECTVRINLALAEESLGDLALEEGDADEAMARWRAGIEALARGGCPTESGRGEQQTEDAAAVDRRLREKLQQQQEQQEEEDEQQEQQDQQQTPEERREQRQQERKERRLEERNDEAAEEQRDHEEDTRDRDYSQYHW